MPRFSILYTSRSCRADFTLSADESCMCIFSVDFFNLLVLSLSTLQKEKEATSEVRPNHLQKHVPKTNLCKIKEPGISTKLESAHRLSYLHRPPYLHCPPLDPRIHLGRWASQTQVWPSAPDIITNTAASFHLLEP